MAKSFESGALLGHVYKLRDGLLVRLRLARSSDAAAVKRLLEAEGVGGSDLEITRLVHFDPRRRYVVCATGLVDKTETLLGVGAITFDRDAPQPDLLVVAEGFQSELGPLLTRALTDAAGGIGRSRAA